MLDLYPDKLLSFRIILERDLHSLPLHNLADAEPRFGQSFSDLLSSNLIFPLGKDAMKDLEEILFVSFQILSEECFQR